MFAFVTFIIVLGCRGHVSDAGVTFRRWKRDPQYRGHVSEVEAFWKWKRDPHYRGSRFGGGKVTPGMGVTFRMWKRDPHDWGHVLAVET